MSLRFALVLAGAVLASGCGTFSVRRAALVPHQQPTQRSGQPMGANRAEVALGATSIVEMSAPREADGANAGVHIPQTQLNGALRFRSGPGLDIGFMWDQGLARGAHSAADDQPDVDNGDVYGGGMTAHYSAETSDPRFRIGITSDFLVYSIPYVEYRTCVDNCLGGMFTDIDKDRDLIPVLAIGVTPSMDLGKVTVFGGVTMRNHPTIPKSEIEQGGEDLIQEEEVEAGPMNFVANAGAELTFRGGFRALFHVYQPVYADPVQYGPTFGVSFTIPLSKDPPPMDQPLVRSARRTSP